MLRRVTATTALKQSTNSPTTTPTKKRGLSKITASPTNNKFSEIFVRELRDPLDNSLLAITFEGGYPINTFLSGAHPIEENDETLFYVPATGTTSPFIFLTFLTTFFSGILLFKKDVIERLFRDGITSTITFMEPHRAPRQQPGGGEGTRPLWYFPVDVAHNTLAMVTSVKDAVVDMNGQQDPITPSRLLSIVTLPPFIVPETDIEGLVAINATIKQRAHLMEDKDQAIASTFFPAPIDCTADSAPTSPGKRYDADDDDGKDHLQSAGGGGPSSPLPLSPPKEIKTEGKRQRK
jgi:hypothetical protein